MKIAAIAIIIVLISIAAFATLSLKPTNKHTLRIGVIAPLTGSDSIWGERIKQGVMLASQDKNTSIFFEDGKCDPKESLTAIQKLIEIDKVDALIGEACSSATLAIAPIAQADEKILISPVSTDPRIPRIGNMIFRNWYSNDIEMKKLSEVVSKLGYNRVGILYTINEWGENRKNIFKNNFNGTVLEEGHEKGASDLRTQLLKIKNSNVEALILIQYTSDMALTLKQMKELDIILPIFATTTVEDPNFLQITGNLSNGIIYASPDIAISEDFKKKYISIYHEEPHQTVATSYDAVNLLYDAFKNVGTDGQKISKYLIGIKNYSGASGIFSFNSDGDVERIVIIRFIENQTTFVYSI